MWSFFRLKTGYQGWAFPYRSPRIEILNPAIRTAHETGIFQHIQSHYIPQAQSLEHSKVRAVSCDPDEEKTLSNDGCPITPGRGSGPASSGAFLCPLLDLDGWIVHVVGFVHLRSLQQLQIRVSMPVQNVVAKSQKLNFWYNFL